MHLTKRLESSFFVLCLGTLVLGSAGLARAGETFVAPLADAFVAGAIGDSISAGFDAVRLGDNREMSWTMGTSTSVDSHAQRLAALYGQPVTSFNEAIAGSVVSDLDDQVTRLLPHNPDYVTIDIGANDVCSWGADYQGDLAAFSQTLHDEIARIVQARPSVRIVIIPVPDMYNLWQVASAQSGCQARWDFIGICKPLLSSNSTDADRQAFVGRWQAINAAIAQVAAGFPGSVLHDASLANMPFTWEDVSSLDCFHPSVAGQALIAEKAWEIVQRNQ